MIAQGPRPKGTLTFVGLADEEARGGLGAKWISENQPEAFSWRNCLSETGGSHLPALDGSDAIGFNVGEKGAGQRRIHVHGDAGHGSTPFGKDFAVVKTAEVARRIAAAQPPAVSNETWEGFVRAFKFDEATQQVLIDGTATDADYEKFGALSAYAHEIGRASCRERV